MGNPAKNINFSKIASSSFLAMFFGWVTAFTIFSIYKYFTGYPWFDDKEFWLFWPAVFMGIAWIIFVLPAIAIETTRALLSDWHISWLLWTVLALASYGLLVLWWTKSYYLLWFPAIAGFMAGLTFPRILKWKSPWTVDFSIPILSILAWFFLIWPLSMRYATKWAYPFGSLREQLEMMDFVIPKIRKGMTRKELNDLLPQAKQLKAGFSSVNSSSRSYDYFIKLEGGIITELEVEKKKKIQMK